MERPTFPAKGLVWGRADEEGPDAIRVVLLKRGHIMTKMGVVFELAESIRQALSVVAQISYSCTTVTA
jgi:hypothetical protein